ncbi:ImmA/IrrE family metallo-endopeptidase [Rhodococcus qingshengii]|uniref:ImmA/IrrE family metallo-endopeptidase n=1 Tax=Rhodococcus qingshengii TaxID=334542 RepID=UPI001C5F8677|nr:ImmA/IrrE family metallo-endopeptidase [Rhodococcus qingshengii]MBW4813133.1 ImmA/IrrE family metallo-endopeptidase [Rhodococcus qingshengii]
MDLLHELAKSMGVTVVERFLPGRQRGRYVHARRSIVLNADMNHRQKTATFGHELGHANYEHEHGTATNAIIALRQERKADEFAAKLLIDRYDYEVAERMYGPHIPTLAVQLGVTVPIIYAWQSLQRRHNPRPE